MKMYYNEKTNELWFRAELIADLTDQVERQPEINAVLGAFSEERWPIKVYDPITPDPVATHSPAVQHRLHALKVDRVLGRINAEIRAMHTPAPIEFRYVQGEEMVQVVVLDEEFNGGSQQHPGIGGETV